MKLKPMRAYPEPEYPVLEDFDGVKILSRSLPERWKSRRIVCLALMFTVASGLYACDDKTGEEPEEIVEDGLQIPDTRGDETVKSREEIIEDGSSPSDYGGAETGNKPEETKKQKPTLPDDGRMYVPVFIHGNGRGSYGCDSVSPPVYLSEDEAAQVIREVAREYGVDFSGSGTKKSDNLPYTNIFDFGEEKTTDTYSGEFVLDGYDEKLGIGYEFVSQQDVKDWNLEGDMHSTVESYDMHGTAERLATAVPETAVFYDPGANFNEFNFKSNDGLSLQEYVKKYTAEQKVRMSEDLRAQVIDFLEWLKAQGVI
jgi:hypothetical protein